MRLPFKFLRVQSQISEREIAAAAGISRLTLRAIENGDGNPTIGSLEGLAAALGKQLSILLCPLDPSDPTYSSYAISLKVKHDGFESWPIHYMEFVDYFRKTADPALLVLPPIKDLDSRLKALLQSIVIYLSEEIGQDMSPWCRAPIFLEQPWFLSETESLKALAIRDAHWAFRRNNIFVQDNFMQRA